MKITSDICKQQIVMYMKNNRSDIEQQFVLQTQDQIDEFEIAYKKGCSKSHWKRMDKRKVGCFSHWQADSIERNFDCKPFDDQLRATIITDAADSTILYLKVEGE